MGAPAPAPLHPDYVWHATAKIWQTPEQGEALMQAFTAEAVVPALQETRATGGSRSRNGIARRRRDEVLHPHALSLGGHGFQGVVPRSQTRLGTRSRSLGERERLCEPRFGELLADDTGARFHLMKGLRTTGIRPKIPQPWPRRSKRIGRASRPTDTNYDFDLLTIGAGSGGVRATRLAATYGARAAVVEEYRVGAHLRDPRCIPKKLLVYASRYAEELRTPPPSVGTSPIIRSIGRRSSPTRTAEIARLEAAYTKNLGRRRRPPFRRSRHLARFPYRAFAQIQSSRSPPRRS